MIPSVGVQLFWMVAIGLAIGYAGYFMFLKYSISMGLSISIGTLGAVFMGMTTYYFAFSMPLMYAVLGSITFLFIANAFLSQEK